MSDWETVTVLRKKPQKTKAESAVNKARREGIPVETQQKYLGDLEAKVSEVDHGAASNVVKPKVFGVKGGAGQNKQHTANKNTAKLDQETEELKHQTVSLGLGRIIQQARQAKNLSQKELATKINEKPQVVNDYEAGRGIPNNAIIGKLERTLGVKLRGKASELGTPLAPPGKK